LEIARLNAFTYSAQVARSLLELDGVGTRSAFVFRAIETLKGLQPG